VRHAVGGGGDGDISVLQLVAAEGRERGAAPSGARAAAAAAAAHGAGLGQLWLEVQGSALEETVPELEAACAGEALVGGLPRFSVPSARPWFVLRSVTDQEAIEAAVL
jgi:hypothetical protein